MMISAFVHSHFITALFEFSHLAHFFFFGRWSFFSSTFASIERVEYLQIPISLMGTQKQKKKVLPEIINDK